MHINCTRRHFMCALELGALGIVSPRKVQGSEKKNKRPNVLFIAIDDLRTSLGCYGDRLAETSYIDKLAQSGLLFTRDYCHQAVCGPSRVSMLTGRLPNNTSVWHNRNLFREKHPDTITLPQLFKNNGYHAQSMGKVFSGNSREEEQDPQSWPAPPLLIGDGWQKYALPENETNGRKGPATKCDDVPDEAYRDGQLAKLAIESLENLKRKRQPFFLAVGFFKSHLPFNALKKYWDLYDPDVLQPNAMARRTKGAPDVAYPDHLELGGYKDMGGPDEQTVNNPVVIADCNSAVHFVYCVEYMRSFYMRSDDDGVTWSKPLEITYAFDEFRSDCDWQAIATGPGHGFQLSNGRLIVPIWIAITREIHK